MPGTYGFDVVDGRGRRRKGRAHAASAATLARSLEEQGLFVVEVRDGGDGVRGESGPNWGRSRAVLDATRALAALLSAGMPLLRAFSIACNVARVDVAAALEDVRGRVQRGESVADAFDSHGAVFSPVYVGLVRAGERTGDLAGAFTRLAGQLEREAEIRSRILSASIYPLILTSVGGLAVLVLIVFVLPRFVGLLDGTGAELPTSTMLLLRGSAILRHSAPALLGLGVVMAFALAGTLNSEAGRRAISRLVLRIPLVGGLRRQALGARFARLLGVLLMGGAPLLGALESVVRSIADPLARDETERIRTRVREGASLYHAVAEGSLFPPVLSEMVAVGEEASQLASFLTRAAELLEAGAERTVQRLVALAEPAMIVVFGGVVAFVALSLLQAIYGINADAFR